MGIKNLAVPISCGGRDLMHAYALFYVGVAALGIPAVALCFVLAGVAKRRAAKVAARSSPV